MTTHPQGCPRPFEPAPPGHEPFPVGSRVRHPVLGAGTVRDYERRCGRIVVAFDDGTERRLALRHVLERDLLEGLSSGA